MINMRRLLLKLIFCIFLFSAFGNKKEPKQFMKFGTFCETIGLVTNSCPQSSLRERRFCFFSWQSPGILPRSSATNRPPFCNMNIITTSHEASTKSYGPSTQGIVIVTEISYHQPGAMNHPFLLHCHCLTSHEAKAWSSARRYGQFKEGTSIIPQVLKNQPGDMKHLFLFHCHCSKSHEPSARS